MANMDSTIIGFYKSNIKMKIMGVQQYCLRVAYVLINLEGIFAKMVKMANQYCSNVATIFNVIWVVNSTYGIEIRCFKRMSIWMCGCVLACVCVLCVCVCVCVCVCLCV